MGNRGPQPVNVNGLKGEATQWAVFFYALRDGQAGRMVHVEWSGPPPKRPRSVRAWEDQVRKGTVLKRTGRPLKTIPIPVAEGAKKLPPEMRAKDWVIFRPVMPIPDAWEQFKRARSVKDVQEVSRAVGKWASQYAPGGDWAVERPTRLALHASELILARQLPNYPRTERPSSDDKRVEFFAKVLAGLIAGIAPITALKRLSHWHWPKDWFARAGNP